MVLEKTRGAVTSGMQNYSWTIVGFLIIWCLLDLLWYNAIVDWGPTVDPDKECRVDGDATYTIGPLSWIKEIISGSSICTQTITSDPKSPCKGDGQLGKWEKYVSRTESRKQNLLCPSEIRTAFAAELKQADDLIIGYTPVQLVAYVIIPLVTVLGIIYAMIFTQVSRAEWIFWFIIASVIFFGLISIEYTTDIPILPEATAPLSYITKKLNMAAADELKYSFIARKQGGEECFVEGTMLGGGTHPENQPPTYTGSCTASTLPMY